MIDDIFRFGCRYLVRVAVALLLFAFYSPSYAASSPVIKIDGGAADLRENVRQYLTLAEEPCSAPNWRLESLMVDAEDEIQQAAQALGYYQLQFTKTLVRANDCWTLQISLTPGPQVVISEFNFVIRDDGAQENIFDTVMQQPDIRRGDFLHHGRYENFKNKIATIAASHGYFDGHFDVARVTVNQVDNTAVVDLVYNTGPRYRIGEIRLTHAILSKDFLKGFLNIREGDYYDTDKLLELKSYFNATNYFSVATASPDIQNLHDQKVDINIQLEERKRFAHSIGAGFSTDTGPRVLLGFENRYVNNAGHSLKVDVSASEIKKTAQVAYAIPMANPSYEFLKLYSGYEKEVTDSTYSNKDTFGVSYTYYQRNQWLHTYAISVENEDSILANEAQYTHLLIPSATYSRTQTDATPYPLQGWSLLARISGSPKTLGSYVSYEQVYLRGKYIYEFAGGRFLLRSELGLTKVNDFDELPASVRFFAGGGTSVRGYDYKSIGPDVPVIDPETGKETRKVIGGENVLVNSIEYDYRVRPTWAVAAFYDIGNAADDFNVDFKRGAGLGVRWISPIGPIRIDVARALDAPNGWNLHISMGPDL